MVNKNKLLYIVVLSLILNLLVINTDTFAVSTPSINEQYSYNPGYEKFNGAWVYLGQVYYSATNNSITILDEAWISPFGTPVLYSHENKITLYHRGLMSGDGYNYYLRNINGTLKLGGNTLLNINHSLASDSSGQTDFVIPGGIKATGLTPNTTYRLLLSYDVVYYAAHYSERGIKNGSFTGNIPFVTMNYINNNIYTDVSIPILSFNDIKDKKIGITLNTLGNPASTQYTVERRTGTNPWEVVASRITTNSFIDESPELKPENTYQYRVLVHHMLDTSGDTTYSTTFRNKYTNTYTVTTTADPAVAAAQEAASKAQAAKEAAEQTLQYSLDAKTSADFVKSEIEHPEYGLQALASQIKNATPFIRRISHPNEATITFGNSFELVINATGIPANMRYRVICEDFDSGWVPNDRITITGLHQEGLKKALVMVSNNPNNPEEGVIAKDEFKFFKASF